MALSLADTIMGAVSVFLPLAGAVLLLGYAIIGIPAKGRSSDIIDP